MNTQENQVSVSEEAKKVALNSRLENLGWGALPIAIGTIWLVPEKLIPQGTLLIAVGVIMFGLNAARYFNGIAMNCFSLGVGILALVAGVGESLGYKLPLFAIALIVIGVAILFRPLFEKDPHGHGYGWSCCGRSEPESRVPRQGTGCC